MSVCVLNYDFQLNCYKFRECTRQNSAPKFGDIDSMTGFVIDVIITNYMIMLFIIAAGHVYAERGK